MSGLISSQFPGSGVMHSNGSALSILLLCPLGHCMVHGHICYFSAVATNNPKKSKRKLFVAFWLTVETSLLAVMYMFFGIFSGCI